MYETISRLLLYGGLPRDSILFRMGKLYRDSSRRSWDSLRVQANAIARQLLDLAVRYSFDGDLWASYLTLLLISSENPFSLASERANSGDGTLRRLAVEDMSVFQTLFHFDFHPLEKELGSNCFSLLQTYRSGGCTGTETGLRIQSLRDQLLQASSPADMLDSLSDFYLHWGVGQFGLSQAFRIQMEGRRIQFLPTAGYGTERLSDLIGYERQKQTLRENTEAFLAGRPANNVLLYGDAGTGKSTCVKALINEYRVGGLRMIELYKHQFEALPSVIAALRNRNYRFIILIDDLSFEENEVSYKYLKAVIEGGVEVCPENVLIYATSNRRHLIKETWADRADMEYREDMHRSDTMQEKLSLAARFGVSINFDCPSRKGYHDIVEGLAARCPEITLSQKELLLQADQWELRHGGVSGRTAQQFIHYLVGTQAG